MFSNACTTSQDDKAYEIKTELFETNSGFFLGALGIVIIIATLYAVFW